MKILFCNKYNYPFSGTETYLFEVIELLRAAGHQAELFSMEDVRGEATAYDHHFLNRIDFKTTSSNPFAKAKLAAGAIYSCEARQRMRRMIVEFRPDIAHVRNIYHHLSPSILWELKAQGVPVVYHVNDFKLLCPSFNMVSNGHACDKCHGGKFWHIVTEGCYPGSRASTLVLAAEAYAHKLAGSYQKMHKPLPRPQPFRKRQVSRGRVGCRENRSTSSFPEIDAGAPCKSRDKCSHPLLWQALAGKRGERPPAIGKPTFPFEISNRWRWSSANRAGDSG